MRRRASWCCAAADVTSAPAPIWRARAAAAPAPAAAHFAARLLAALDTLPKPTIAVVHGAAVGGGAAFAACCDVVLATEDAFFSVPEVRVGMPPLGVAPFLVRAMGHRSSAAMGFRASVSPPRRLCASAWRIRFAPPKRSRRRSRASPTRSCTARRAPIRDAQARGRPICFAVLADSLATQAAARLQDPRKRSKGLRASARSASRAGIRNEAGPGQPSFCACAAAAAIGVAVPDMRPTPRSTRPPSGRARWSGTRRSSSTRRCGR